MKCSSHCYYKEQILYEISQRIIWSEFFRVACAFWHRPWCLMLPWRYLKVGSSWSSLHVGWERGVAKAHRPSFPPGFFHGVSRVGWGEWMIRPPTSFSAPSLWTTWRGLGLGKREALTWSRVNETFSFLHEKTVPLPWKVAERKAMAVFGSWLKAENGEVQTEETVGKNVKPLIFVLRSCSSCSYHS